MMLAVGKNLFALLGMVPHTWCCMQSKKSSVSWWPLWSTKSVPARATYWDTEARWTRSKQIEGFTWIIRVRKGRGGGEMEKWLVGYGSMVECSSNKQKQVDLWIGGQPGLKWVPGQPGYTEKPCLQKPKRRGTGGEGGPRRVRWQYRKSTCSQAQWPESSSWWNKYTDSHKLSSDLHARSVIHT